jgi:hypothetical protein
MDNTQIPRSKGFMDSVYDILRLLLALLEIFDKLVCFLCSILSDSLYTEPKKKLSPSLIVDMLVQFQSFWLKAYIFVK